MPVLWPPLVNVLSKFIHPGLSHALQVLYRRDKEKKKKDKTPSYLLVSVPKGKLYLHQKPKIRYLQAALAGRLLTVRVFIMVRSMMGLARGLVHILLPACGAADNMLINYQSWQRFFSQLWQLPSCYLMMTYT